MDRHISAQILISEIATFVSTICKQYQEKNHRGPNMSPEIDLEHTQILFSSSSD